MEKRRRQKGGKASVDERREEERSQKTREREETKQRRKKGGKEKERRRQIMAKEKRKGVITDETEGMSRTAREKHMLIASAPAVASSSREALDIFMPVCKRVRESVRERVRMCV